MVPIDYDEKKVCDQIVNINKLYNNNDFLNNFVILTTTDCNARCFYCYEHGSKRINMTKPTANDIAKFIIKKSKRHPITIKWFGGEPLYNSEVIDIICDNLRSAGIKFSSHMTTNAYLLSEKTAIRAKKRWNMKRVQITLDGTEFVYNKTKSFIYGTDINAFKIVTDNIESLLENDFYVTIRINLIDENVSDVYKLIDYIDKRYANKTNINVYIANLYDLDRKNTKDKILKMNQLSFELNKYLLDKNLKKYSIESWSTLNRGCMAQNDKSVVISPTGILGKCEHFFESENVFGSIYNDDVNAKIINYWNYFERIDSCNQCAVYPNCYGEGNCPSISHNCDIVEKKIKLYDIEMCIRSKYYDYKKTVRE